MKNTNFTEGKIFSPLLMFVFPILFSLFLQSLYGAVDLLIVGQFSDAANVSAVASGSQIMQTITFMITDLAMGTTVLLGQLIGQRKSDKCGNVIGVSIFFFAILGIIIAVVMQFCAAPFAHLLNVPDEAFAPALAYIRICSGGAVFIVAYNILGSIFRGLGNAKMPLMTVAFASVFNIFGDLFFVKVLKMGAAGAAIATIMAQCLSVLISLIIIRRSGLPFEFSVKNIHFDAAVVKRILKIGLPIAASDILVSLSFLIVLAVVNKLGVVASAGVGVAEKLCGFIMLVPSAFSQSMSAFVAQNVGARKLGRARKALAYGIGISFACGLLLGYAAFFHGVELSSLFTRDHAVQLASADYLKAYGIDCLLTAFLFCFIGYFNGSEHTRLIMLQNLVGAFLIRTPLCIIFSMLQPVSIFRIGLATPCSSLVQNAICITFFIYLLKKERSRK